MRLLNYLTESTLNFKPYLNFINTNPNILFYRGFQGSSIKTDKDDLVYVNKNRNPVGGILNVNEYKIFNDWLVKNKHCDRTKSINCSLYNNNLFGKNYIIVPEGQFNYTFVKANDLNIFDLYDEFNLFYVAWYFNFFENKFLFFNLTTNTSIKTKKDKYDISKDTKIECVNQYYSSDSDNYPIFSKNLLDKQSNKLKSFFETNKNLNDAKTFKYELWIECDRFKAFENIEKYNKFLKEII